MTTYLNTGVTVPIQMQDGKPLCSHCISQMIEVDPGYWSCPTKVAAEKELDRSMKQAIEKILESSPQVNPPVT